MRARKIPHHWPRIGRPAHAGGNAASPSGRWRDRRRDHPVPDLMRACKQVFWLRGRPPARLSADVSVRSGRWAIVARYSGATAQDLARANCSGPHLLPYSPPAVAEGTFTQNPLLIVDSQKNCSICSGGGFEVNPGLTSAHRLSPLPQAFRSVVGYFGIEYDLDGLRFEELQLEVFLSANPARSSCRGLNSGERTRASTRRLR